MTANEAGENQSQDPLRHQWVCRLESSVPNVITHQTFMSLNVNIQTSAPLPVDWDGPIAFLIKKVGRSAPIEGYLCFLSVEMISVDADGTEGVPKEQLPMEVR